MYEMSVCMCAKQQTNDLYIIICNCIYIVVIDCGWNNNVTEGILSALSKSVCRSANLVSSVKVNISNNNRGPRQCTLCTLHMQVKSEFLQLLLKNKLTDFIASVSEAVSGIFLPPPKLRPQKNNNVY